MSLRIKQQPAAGAGSRHKAAVARWPCSDSPAVARPSLRAPGHPGPALREPALQGTREVLQPFGRGQTCRERGPGLSRWEKHQGATEYRDTERHPRWAALSFAGQSLISTAQSPAKLVPQLFCSPPLPSPPSSREPELCDSHLPPSSAVGPMHRSRFSSPPWLSGFPSLCKLPSHKPPLHLQTIKFWLFSPSLPPSPSLLTLQLPRWSLFSLQKSWLDKEGKRLLLLLSLSKFSLLFRRKHFDFAGVEKICFFLFGWLKLLDCKGHLFCSSQVSWEYSWQ